MLKEVPNAKFMIIGDGIQKPQLQRLCKDLDIDNYVRFVGRIPYNEVPKYLSQSKMIVFPSEIPTGLALLEAAAAKKAVITTANPWALETLGDTPLFIEERNHIDVARAITYLLKDPTERSKLAKRSWLKVASTFGWKKVASKHTQLYNEIIA